MDEIELIKDNFLKVSYKEQQQILKYLRLFLNENKLSKLSKDFDGVFENYIDRIKLLLEFKDSYNDYKSDDKRLIRKRFLEDMKTSFFYHHSNNSDEELKRRFYYSGEDIEEYNKYFKSSKISSKDVHKFLFAFSNLDIYKYGDEIFKSNICVVNQKSFIFNMSIRKNLSLIDSNKKRQIEICKRVGIHDFIMSLPKGYNTILSDDASNISGGQKQLFSLARALLTNSKIILLDEVTSAIDVDRSNQIIKLLNELKKDHTIIAITHNRSLIRKSDCIIVVDKGKARCVSKEKFFSE